MEIALKTLKSFETLVAPIPLASSHIGIPDLAEAPTDQRILRMLISPKYDDLFHIPPELKWLTTEICNLAWRDEEISGISRKNTWCYVTVRSGVDPDPDHSWHLDGGSLRTELIPERNYVYKHEHPLLYREGTVHWMPSFDPMKHNMFQYIEDFGDLSETKRASNGWNLLWPNVLHRRPRTGVGHQTFIRVTFADIEIRDSRCTQNSLLPPQLSYGRNPCESFRDTLTRWAP